MYFLKCILCDTPNVTYAMQECMGKIEFMAKMSTPHLFFDNSNTGHTHREGDRQTETDFERRKAIRPTVNHILDIQRRLLQVSS